MKTYIAKLKHILPAFFLVTFGTVFGLTFIRWILCIQFSIIDIKEEIWVTWIPIIFPWIPITLWLRQRFRILTFKSDNDRGRLFFQCVCWGTMAAMLLISQAYLTTAAGKLKHLSTIADIEKTPAARYYRVKTFAVIPSFGGSFTEFRQSGKYNQHLNFNIYFVTPIKNDTTRKFVGTIKYWYGVNFREQISNRLSSEEKEKKYETFYNECLEAMKNYAFYDVDYFERVPTSDERYNYLKAIEARLNEPAGNEFIILEPVREKFEDRNGNKFAWIFGSFGIGLSVLLFSLIWPGYSEAQRRQFLSGKKPKEDDLADMMNYLVPKGEHFATSVILDLNILVWLLMILSGVHMLSPNGQELLQWGANRRFETSNGAYWRLFTSMFVHGGFMHLILNIAGLVIAAIFVEPILGRKKYFLLYILSGVCGSLASIWWYPNTISVGASGAIFGLYGAILALLLTNAFPEGGKKGIFTGIGIYVAVSLLWGLTGGIDNAAHIGGLLSGAVLGIILYKLDKGKKRVG